MQVQFLENSLAVSLDRVHAQVEPASDLLVAIAFGEQLEDLTLAFRQKIIAVLTAFPPDSLDMLLLEQAFYYKLDWAIRQ